MNVIMCARVGRGGRTSQEVRELKSGAAENAKIEACRTSQEVRELKLFDELPTREQVRELKSLLSVPYGRNQRRTSQEVRELK